MVVEFQASDQGGQEGNFRQAGHGESEASEDGGEGLRRGSAAEKFCSEEDAQKAYEDFVK